MSNIITEWVCTRVCACEHVCHQCATRQVSLGEPLRVTQGRGACVCSQQWGRLCAFGEVSVCDCVRGLGALSL